MPAPRSPSGGRGAIDRVLDDPVGALSAHGIAGIWGTLACGLFAAPRIVDAPGVPGNAGLVYGGGLEGMYGYPEQFMAGDLADGVGIGSTSSPARAR